jgi:hypothetical protein
MANKSNRTGLIFWATHACTQHLKWSSSDVCVRARAWTSTELDLHQHLHCMPLPVRARRDRSARELRRDAYACRLACFCVEEPTRSWQWRRGPGRRSRPGHAWTTTTGGAEEEDCVVVTSVGRPDSGASASWADRRISLRSRCMHASMIHRLPERKCMQ